MECVFLPPIPHFSVKFGSNEITQLRRCANRAPHTIGKYSSGHVKGVLLTSTDGTTTLVLPAVHVPSIRVDQVLLCPRPDRVLDPSELHFLDPAVRWLTPASLVNPDSSTLREYRDAALSSWAKRFHFREEALDASGAIASTGLRAPQIGAIHATIGHWRAQMDPATIVMPTGTGKTETMLSLLVAERIPRLLVIVPTDALRKQIAQKFMTLGLLPELGVVSEGATLPVVATLCEEMQTTQDVDRIALAANVLVTTAALAAGLRSEMQALLASHCSHLFIDEAHHVVATTWSAFKQRFIYKPIIQFTATPFRRDGRHIEGRQIFAYPLRKAQIEGYFRPIQFLPVDVYPAAAGHEEIAKAAARQLRKDLAAGFDHIVLARTSTIPRAQALLKVYESIKDVKAVVVHSKLSDRELAKRLTSLRSRASRVAICVDMFGEGFDMPELKIAAVHDVHKSLTTTVQFIGRFTRAAKKVGPATLICNLGDIEVNGALRDLYREDSDWNRLLPGLTERNTRRHRERSEFYSGFRDLPAEVPLFSIEPKMSALVYHTSCADWVPESMAQSLPEEVQRIGPVINTARTVALYLTRELSPVRWGRMATPLDATHQLYLCYWHEPAQLLFVNSTNHDSFHESLVKDITRDTAELISGDVVFRALHGIKRLTLLNLGLKHTMNRATRFTMYVGSDIVQGLSEALQQNRIKTNLFGSGYEDGERTSAGCSLKGRIWSYKVAEDISEWVSWCQKIGKKLLSKDISIDEILSNAISPTIVESRPNAFPTAIEWPDDFVLKLDLSLQVEVEDASAPFFEANLDLFEPSAAGPLRFRLEVRGHSAVYELSFTKEDVKYIPTRGQGRIDFPRRGKLLVEEVFARWPPIVRFGDGSWLEANRYFPAPTIAEPFSRDRLISWDWTGTDIKSESQGPSKVATSIQYRALQELGKGALGCQYDILLDDDGSNEVADIVGLKEDDGRLHIHLLHCKFSKEPTPGARIDDLYAVCGQAQKSIAWRGKVERLTKMLVHRAAARQHRTGISPFERGDMKRLRGLSYRAHLLEPVMSIWIVQPGVSRAQATQSQLHLLAVTELYLLETHGVPLHVIVSA